MPAFIDQTGTRFGRLVAKARAPNQGKRVHWLCLCDCGKECIVSSTHLVSGHTESCGCFAAEVAARLRPACAKHGLAGSSEYGIWRNMILRCHSPDARGYERYGGRGITVCQEWRDSVEAFVAHVGRRPSLNHTLDRIRNAEGYKPGNVRWATAEMQARNRSSNILVEINGEVLIVTAWCARLNHDTKAVFARIRIGWPADRAITTPTKRGYK